MLKCLIWDQNQLLANSYSRITVVWFVYFFVFVLNFLKSKALTNFAFSFGIFRVSHTV